MPVIIMSIAPSLSPGQLSFVITSWTVKPEFEVRFKVYVKDPKTGNVKKVNFGHGGTSAKRKTMRIRKSNPARRRSFRARHNCANPGPKTKARYWSCRKW